MVTDGADTSDAALDETARQPEGALDSGVHRRRRPGALRARHPGHARRDAAHACSRAPSLVVDVVVSQTGYGGQTVPLSVEDEGRIVSTQEVTLPPDGESATVRVRFTANEAGARLFRFKVPPQAGEQVTQNNARDALIEVDDRAREGALLSKASRAPKPSSSRRAVEDDKNLQVVDRCSARRRTSTYRRRRRQRPTSWSAAFPKTREELFAYRASFSAASRRRRSRPISCG